MAGNLPTSWSSTGTKESDWGIKDPYKTRDTGGPTIPLKKLLEQLKVKKNKTKADKTKIAQLTKLKKKNKKT